jgi:hypothetical protein
MRLCYSETSLLQFHLLQFLHYIVKFHVMEIVRKIINNIIILIYNCYFIKLKMFCIATKYTKARDGCCLQGGVCASVPWRTRSAFLPTDWAVDQRYWGESDWLERRQCLRTLQVRIETFLSFRVQFLCRHNLIVGCARITMQNCCCSKYQITIILNVNIINYS